MLTVPPGVILRNYIVAAVRRIDVAAPIDGDAFRGIHATGERGDFDAGDLRMLLFPASAT